jgi:hypothetical protein
MVSHRLLGRQSILRHPSEGPGSLAKSEEVGRFKSGFRLFGLARTQVVQ